jgi:hypothetical protein
VGTAAQAGSSGGGINFGGGTGPRVANAIIATNSASLAPDIYQTRFVQNLGGNLIGVGEDLGPLTVFKNGQQLLGGYVVYNAVGTSDYPVDPALDVLADYGGATKTRRLNMYSPAIGLANTNSSLISQPGTDQRGAARGGDSGAVALYGTPVAGYGNALWYGDFGDHQVLLAQLPALESSAFTVEGRFSNYYAGGTQTLWSYGAPDRRSMWLDIEQNIQKLHFVMLDDAGQAIVDLRAPFTPRTATWESINVSFDGSAARIYADGALLGSAAVATGAAPIAFGNDLAMLWLGNRFNDAPNFIGAIDEVRVLNVARAPGPDAVLDSQIDGYWKFDELGMEADYGLLRDSSSHDRDASLFADSYVTRVESTAPVEIYVREDEPYDFYLPGFDPLGGDTSFSLPGDATTRATSKGSITLLDWMTGSARYTPGPNLNGVDTFQYTVWNGIGWATTQATVRILPVNDAPVFQIDPPTPRRAVVLRRAVSRRRHRPWRARHRRRRSKTRVDAARLPV